MAKYNGRYVQFYTPGSVACKVEIRQEQDWAPLPVEKSKPQKVIHVDPVAVAGFLIAVCMLVLMAVGIQQLNRTRQEVAVLEHYVAQLSAENQSLSQQYADGYQLEVVRQKALDMGLVPVEEISQVQIQVTAPQSSSTEKTSLPSQWDAILSTLFA